MAELSMDLKKLETVRGAFDILTYLYRQPNHMADGDDIMDDLDLSSRRFDKAKRRLVTRSYIQMSDDYIYELTYKGVESAEELVAFDKANGGDEGGIQRQLAVVVPRNFVYGQTSDLKVGIEPNDAFTDMANIVVHVNLTHATLGDFNEIAQLTGDALVLETTITPDAYDKARIKVEVYQMQGGANKKVGGMYVDVLVMEDGDTGDNFAYTADLMFEG